MLKITTLIQLSILFFYPFPLATYLCSVLCGRYHRLSGLLLPLLLLPTSVSRYHVNVSLYSDFEVVKPLVTLYASCLRELTTWHAIVTM